MLKTLDVVKHAISSKPLIAILTHYRIENKRIQANNGKVTIDAPFAYFDDLAVTLPALHFNRAVKTTGGDFNWRVLDSGKFSISKKKFRAQLPIPAESAYPLNTPSVGTSLPPDDIINAFKTLRPFVSEDASRPWSRAILFKDKYAYATNNIILAKLPVNCTVESAVPVTLVDAIINIGLKPVKIIADSLSITFYLENDI